MTDFPNTTNLRVARLGVSITHKETKNTSPLLRRAVNKIAA
jgi:hypothetical protein